MSKPSVSPAAGSPAAGSVPRVRVMFVVGGMGVGGAQKHIFDLIRQLDRSRFAVSVVAFRYGDQLYQRYYGECLRALGVEVINLAVEGRTGLFARFPTFLRLVRQLEPDILHLFLYFPSVYGCLAKLLLGRRAPCVILSKRSLELTLRMEKRAVYRYLLMPASDVVTAVSEPVRRRCEELGASPTKITVIENGIQPIEDAQRGRLRRLLGVAEDTALIGSIGSLTVRKAQKHLLRAASLLFSDVLDAHLVLISDGKRRPEIEAEVRQLGIETRVHLPGFLLPATDYIADLSIFVLPSAEEGMSNALLEAMTIGVACIVSDIPSNRQVITHGKDGLLVDVEDHAALADAIRTLLRDSNLRHSLGAHAQETIRRRFDPGPMIRANEALYTRLAQQRQAKWQPSLHAQSETLRPSR